MRFSFQHTSFIGLAGPGSHWGRSFNHARQPSVITCGEDSYRWTRYKQYNKEVDESAGIGTIHNY